MRRLDGASAFFIYSNGPRSYTHTLKIAFIESPQEYDHGRFLELLEESLDGIPYARWKLGMPALGINHPYWIQDLDFRVSNHVTRIACPGPGDRRALCELISSLLVQPLDKSMPLWKLWVVEGLEGNRTALITMLDHAYTDGTGFSNLLNALTTPGARTVLSSEQLGVDSQKNPSELWMFLHSLLELPVLLLRSTVKLMKDSVKLRQVKKAYQESGKSLPPDPGKAPASPLNTVLSPGRTFYYDGIPFVEFKAICDRHKVTVNELLLAVVTGAVRSLYLERGYSMEGPLVSGIAVNMRTGDMKDGILGNAMANSFVSLPIHIDDPFERLALIRDSSQVMKDYLQATPGISTLEAISLLPPAAVNLMKWMVRKSEGKLGIFGNLSVSNVPGPTQPIQLPAFETEVLDWVSLGQLMFNMGLSITAWRYVDRLNICLMADQEVIPDGEHFLRLVLDAFEEYRN